MNLHQLSQSMLEEALQSGTITLGNGTVLQLTTAQVLTTVRYAYAKVSTVPLPEGLPSIPKEMVSTGTGDIQEPLAPCIDCCILDKARSPSDCIDCLV